MRLFFNHILYLVIMLMMIDLCLPLLVRGEVCGVRGGPFIFNLRESNQTATSITISWYTDIDSFSEVHYTEDRGFNTFKRVNDTSGGKIHRITLRNLQPNQRYYYEIQSGEVIDNNEGGYYQFITPQTSSPGNNFFIGGKLLSEDKLLKDETRGFPLALVFITITHNGIDSRPLSTTSDKEGIWVFNLADLKNSSSGEKLFYSMSDSVYIEAQGQDGWWNSEVKSVSDLVESQYYTLNLIPHVVDPPAFSLSSTAFTDSVRVALSSGTEGAQIHYTIDGTEPTIFSPMYVSPLVLTRTSTVWAKGFKPNWKSSNSTVETYRKRPIPYPWFYYLEEQFREGEFIRDSGFNGGLYQSIPFFYFESQDQLLYYGQPMFMPDEPIFAYYPIFFGSYQWWLYYKYLEDQWFYFQPWDYSYP